MISFLPAVIRSIRVSLTNVRDIFVSQETKDKEFFENTTPEESFTARIKVRGLLAHTICNCSTDSIYDDPQVDEC